MPSVEQLEIASREADLQLGVAEDLGWVIAMLAGVVLHLFFGHWLAFVPGAALGYLGATWSYRRRARAAEQAYYQAANLGPYFKPPALNEGRATVDKG